ncbi:MAG: FG-GAP repeat protein [Thermoanaerobaculia bacterium]
MASADLDHDGYDDLAIGVPDESLGSATSAGAVQVLFGTADGLAAARNQLWTQNTPDVDDTAESNDRFGVALTVGDFNGDTTPDLVIGVEETLGAATQAGAVHVLYGRGNQGPQTDRIEFWTQNSSGMEDSAEVGDFFGDSLAAGFFDGDRFGELVVGVPSEALSTVQDVGAAAVLFGEMETFFVDGFESGDTTAWSLTQN